MTEESIRAMLDKADIDPHEFATSYEDAVERANRVDKDKPSLAKALKDFKTKGHVYLED